MAGERILLVDDDRTNTHIVSSALRSAGGYEVLVENNATLALEKARAFRPDLVVLDVHMALRNGGEVAARLKTDQELGRVPIIFFSSFLTPTEKKASMARRYLSKAARPDDLLGCVASVFA